MPATRVLLVDDHAPTLLGIGDYLRALGHEVDCARDCRDAKRLLTRRAYALVVTDLDLGDGDGTGGFEVIRAACERRPGAPVVLITGHGSPQVAREARRLGARAVLAKPVPLGRLTTILGDVSKGEPAMSPRTIDEPPGSPLVAKPTSSDTPISVLVADPYPIVRHGIRAILSGSPDISVCSEAGSEREIFERLRNGSASCSVVCLEIAMSDASPLELVERIRREFPRIPVLVVSGFREKVYAGRALDAGASGYLGQDCAPEQLADAVRRVAAGEARVAPRIDIHAGAPKRQNGRAPKSFLSGRELEVLRRLGSGRTVKEAAEELRLSAKTVSTYRERLLKKIGVKGTAELIRYAVENRVVD